MINDKSLTPEKAIQRVEALCARQERCSYDIRMKLRQWQISNTDIERMLKRLITDGFINDERYARMFIRDKRKFNKWGPLKITYALRSKSFSEEIISKALGELEPDNDESTLKELLSKKMRGIKAKSPYDLKTKLIRFGISRGFNFELVNKTASLIVKEA
jgi:regulatory protein